MNDAVGSPVEAVQPPYWKDACIHLAKAKNSELVRDDTLFEMVRGPDFPTGGTIIETVAAATVPTTAIGNGRVPPADVPEATFPGEAPFDTATITVPRAILTESTLSFIGLGVEPPLSSWGTLASEGWQLVRVAPHLLFEEFLFYPAGGAVCILLYTAWTGGTPRAHGGIYVLALLAATALVLYLCYLMALPFVPALTWALALAVLFMPVHRWIESIV